MPPSSAVVKNRYRCTSATPICLLGMEGESFNFSSSSVGTPKYRWQDTVTWNRI